MDNKYDHAINREQQRRLAMVSNKDIRLTLSAAFITSAITALLIYSLRFY